MHLRSLELDEFRSYRKLRVTLAPAGFRAIGLNASGKSTLLEAIAMLATTRSSRTSSEREIANWESGLDVALPPYARIRGEFDRGDGAHSVEIGITLDNQLQGRLKKLVRFDDRPVRAIDAVGQLKTVLFSPEDVDLISGPPAARRRYLDIAISQASRTYLASLSRYGKVLEQRNSLLRSFSRDRLPPTSRRVVEELSFWDAELAASAADVLAERLGAIRLLSTRSQMHFQTLTGIDSLHVSYFANRLQLPFVEEPNANWTVPAQEPRQALSAAMATGLGEWRVEELRRGVTALGPHRDDFSVHASGVDLSKFGSRGQQRLALIAIKLAELDLLEASAGEPPLLLLDDILSELDERHRRTVVELLAARSAQICVTATDLADLEAPELAHLPILRVADGTIEAATGE